MPHNPSVKGGDGGLFGLGFGLLFWGLSELSVLYSLKKQGVDVAAHLRNTLDELAKNINQYPFPLIFPRAGLNNVRSESALPQLPEDER